MKETKEEKTFTEEELEQMADAMLAEHAEEPKPKKKSSKKKDAEAEGAEKPAEKAADKTPEERLNDLLEKGKKNGKLNAKELEILEELNLDPDAVDKFYETLEANNIDIDMPTGDVLPAIEDVLPEIEDLAELEEVTEEEINNTEELADSLSTDDPVRM